MYVRPDRPWCSGPGVPRRTPSPHGLLLKASYTTRRDRRCRLSPKSAWHLLKSKLAAIPFETARATFQSHQRTFGDGDRHRGVFGHKRLDRLAIPGHRMLDIENGMQREIVTV